MDIVRLMRPHQWVKNLFVFLPMFFGGKLGDSWCWLMSTVVFFAFSCVASAVYCLNDVVDVKSDSLHPQKCKRPIAAGKVSVTSALILASFLFLLSIALCLFLCELNIPTLVGIICFYFILNIAYCLKLKQVAIIDVMIVAFGFVLRVAAGGFACDIVLSPWIISLTFLLAMFLAFAKRRDDVVIMLREGVELRKSIKNYSLDFLNLTLGLLAAVTIVCYIMYTVSPDVTSRIGSDYVYISSLFVIGGVLRYLQIALVDEKSGSPTRILLKDRFIQAMIILWIAVFLLLLYL